MINFYSFNKIRSFIKYIPVKIWWLSLISVIFAFLSVFAEYVIAYFIQIFLFHLKMTTEVTSNSLTRYLQDDINLFFIIFVSIIIIKGIILFLLTMTNMIFAETFIFETRKDLFKNIFSNGSTWSFDLGFTTNLMAEVFPKSSLFITAAVRFAILFIQTSTLGLICIFYLPKEFLSSVFVFILFAPIILFLNRRSRILGKGLLHQGEKLNKHLMKSLKNILFIRIIGIQKNEERSILAIANQYHDLFIKNSKFYSLAITLPSTVGTILVFLLFYYFNSKNPNATGLITLFYLLFRFIQYSSELIGITNSLSGYFPNFLISMEILEMAHSNKLIDNDSGKIIKQETGSFNLETQNISFGFDGKGLVFKDLNLNLEEGQILVLKGSSGSGKSTLLMNVLGIYKPLAGRIFWGGEELSSFKQSDFRKNIGYVGPEPYLVSGSIKENLCYGLISEPSLEKIKEVCSLAEMDSFLGLDNRVLNSHLTEQGEGLSMGQKQRLGLARALLRSPRILVLDEITANLDKATEMAIIKNISKLKGKMTILVATHSDAFDSIADIKYDFGLVDKGNI